MKTPIRSASAAAMASIGASLVLVAGCRAYTSEYVPPADGRARAIMQGDEIVMAVGPAPTPACLAAIGVRPRVGRGLREVGEFWVPIYFGLPIHVVTPGIAPAPPTILARAKHTPAAGVGVGSAGAGIGGGGGGGGGEVWIAIFAVALIVVSFVAIGVSLHSPELVGAQAIDRVNFYNDLARIPGSACSPEAQRHPR